jgi:hypothetical protein
MSTTPLLTSPSGVCLYYLLGTYAITCPGREALFTTDTTIAVLMFNSVSPELAC